MKKIIFILSAVLLSGTMCLAQKINAFSNSSEDFQIKDSSDVKVTPSPQKITTQLRDSTNSLQTKVNDLNRSHDELGSNETSIPDWVSYTFAVFVLALFIYLLLTHEKLKKKYSKIKKELEKEKDSLVYNQTERTKLRNQNKELTLANEKMEKELSDLRAKVLS